METLYLAYNDECDSARANIVRKQLLGTGRYSVEGYMPFTTWSKTKFGCSTDEIKRNIEEWLLRCCATLVLIARQQVNLGHIACKSDGVCPALIQFSDDKILACTPDLLIPRSACWLLLRHGFYSLSMQVHPWRVADSTPQSSQEVEAQ